MILIESFVVQLGLGEKIVRIAATCLVGIQRNKSTVLLAMIISKRINLSIQLETNLSILDR